MVYLPEFMSSKKKNVKTSVNEGKFLHSKSRTGSVYDVIIYGRYGSGDDLKWKSQRIYSNTFYAVSIAFKIRISETLLVVRLHMVSQEHSFNVSNESVWYGFF